MKWIFSQKIFHPFLHLLPHPIRVQHQIVNRDKCADLHMLWLWTAKHNIGLWKQFWFCPHIAGFLCCYKSFFRLKWCFLITSYFIHSLISPIQTNISYPLHFISISFPLISFFSILFPIQTKHKSTDPEHEKQNSSFLNLEFEFMESHNYK